MTLTTTYKKENSKIRDKPPVTLTTTYKNENSKIRDKPPVTLTTTYKNEKTTTFEKKRQTPCDLDHYIQKRKNEPKSTYMLCSLQYLNAVVNLSNFFLNATISKFHMSHKGR